MVDGGVWRAGEVIIVLPDYNCSGAGGSGALSAGCGVDNHERSGVGESGARQG